MITDFARIQLLRDDDKFLMDHFSTNFQGERLCKLNFMQVSLHAVSLADITTSDGQKITNAAWFLKRGNMLREDMQWPRSPSDFPASWLLLWQTALQVCFVNNVYQETSQEICIPLGNWYDSAVEYKLNVCVS